jgi:hypothetical protein
MSGEIKNNRSIAKKNVFFYKINPEKYYICRFLKFETHTSRSAFLYMLKKINRLYFCHV